MKDRDKAMFWEAKIGRWLWSVLAIVTGGESIWLLLSFPFKPSVLMLVAMSIISAFSAYTSNRLYKLYKEG